MTVVRIALPVLHGRRRFHFDKGRPWSIIEHVVLSALAKNPSTAADLATRGEVGQRVIIEALIRLMRAGWVEMVERRAAVTFRITDNGMVAVSSDELPNVPRRLSRNMNFVIEQISGTVYRSRELPFHHEHVILERAKKETIAWIERPGEPKLEEIRPLVDALFMDDEKFISMDFNGERLSTRWSLVTVRDQIPEGLPSRTPLVVTNAVKEAAKEAIAQKDVTTTIVFQAEVVGERSIRPRAQTHKVNLSERDLVLGGPEHKQVITAALKRAKYRVLIHSTFISVERFNNLFPDIRDAVGRGVNVDILWGQEQSTEGRRATRDAVIELNKQLENQELHALRICPFSTGSHCKVILSDDGHPDRFSAWVGSCNWLSSPFRSLEASIRVRDSEIVADIVDEMAELSRGGRGYWSDLTNELVLARK